MREQIAKFLLLVGFGFGVLSSALAVHMFRLWIVNVDNPLRHEHMFGVAIGLLLAVPALSVSSASAFLLRRQLHAAVTSFVYCCTFLVISAFVALWFSGSLT